MDPSRGSLRPGVGTASLPPLPTVVATGGVPFIAGIPGWMGSLELERAIQEQLRSDSIEPASSFWNRWRQLVLDFHTALANSRPLLILAAPASLTHQRPGSSLPRPPSRSKPPPVVSLDSDSDGGLHRYLTTSKRFTLSEVGDICHGVPMGLPSDSPHPLAVERMIRLSQDHWHHPVHQFLTHSRGLGQAMVVEQVHKVFGPPQPTPDYARLLHVCATFWEDAVASSHAVARQVLNWEVASKPHALNADVLHLANDRARTTLYTRRQEAWTRHHIKD